MKEKVMVFIVGLLLGAVIATGVFYIYTNNNSNDCNQNNMQMNGGQPPELPDGSEPPEKPDGENGQPPALPSDNNTQNN